MHTFSLIVTVTLEPGVIVVPADGERMVMPCASAEDAKSAIVAVAHLMSCIFGELRYFSPGDQREIHLCFIDSGIQPVRFSNNSLDPNNSWIALDGNRLTTDNVLWNTQLIAGCDNEVLVRTIVEE